MEKVPLFIGISEEGGKNSPLAENGSFDTVKIPDMSEIGSDENEDHAYTAGYTIGKYLKRTASIWTLRRSRSLREMRREALKAAAASGRIRILSRQ